MNLIIQLIGLALFFLGLSHGTAWPRTREPLQLARAGLFWTSVAGLLGMLASLIAVFGIGAAFDESSDAPHGFDMALAIAQRLVIACIAISGIGHLFLWKESKQAAGHELGH